MIKHRKFKILDRVRHIHFPECGGTIIGFATEIVADNEFWYWVYFDGIGDPEMGEIPEPEDVLEAENAATTG